MDNKKDCGCKKTKKRKVFSEGDIEMSIPEGHEFGKWYSTNSLKENYTHTKEYYNTERNKDPNKKTSNNFGWHLNKVVHKITKLLKTKNASYGNSALIPLNVFSKLDAEESLCARLDDKLARIQNSGINDQTEDTLDDLIGYLLLLKMAKERKESK